MQLLLGIFFPIFGALNVVRGLRDLGIVNEPWTNKVLGTRKNDTPGDHTARSWSFVAVGIGGFLVGLFELMLVISQGGSRY